MTDAMAALERELAADEADGGGGVPDEDLLDGADGADANTDAPDGTTDTAEAPAESPVDAVLESLLEGMNPKERSRYAGKGLAELIEMNRQAQAFIGRLSGMDAEERARAAQQAMGADGGQAPAADARITACRPDAERHFSRMQRDARTIFQAQGWRDDEITAKLQELQPAHSDAAWQDAFGDYDREQERRANDPATQALAQQAYQTEAVAVATEPEIDAALVSTVLRDAFPAAQWQGLTPSQRREQATLVADTLLGKSVREARAKAKGTGSNGVSPSQTKVKTERTPVLSGDSAPETAGDAGITRSAAYQELYAENKRRFRNELSDAEIREIVVEELKGRK